MWALLHVQPDGAPVFEDYVSGPPPANGVALDTVLEQPVPAVTVSCADEMICPWLYGH